ncbi:MAG: bifunctional riboflavin kinase/FAD synthetase [Candidatus Sericytochromatia bacterium]|nr:bifunctional riboflavin kinase/FAD synthetase [Candidatus Sericytochromatia bacterium]
MNLHYFHYPEGPNTNHTLGAVVAIGTFDGLHRGHQRLFDVAQAKAQRLGVPCAVFTFVEHPRTILRPDHAPQLLTPWSEKLERLEAAGIDTVYAAHFTQALSKLTPEQFVEEILHRNLGLRGIVTGFNFRFGHAQTGTPESLQALGNERGISVEIVPPVEDERGVISSSRLRSLVQEGRVDAVKDLLGYPYTLEGHVVHGDKRGRTIGFPTANLAIPSDKLLPAYGVYACVAKINGLHEPAVVNIGCRPTVEGKEVRVEVHLLTGGGDLYGQKLRLFLMHHLRGEQAFPSLDALKEQISADCLRAMQLLCEAQAPSHREIR